MYFDQHLTIVNLALFIHLVWDICNIRHQNERFNEINITDKLQWSLILLNGGQTDGALMRFPGPWGKTFPPGSSASAVQDILYFGVLFFPTPSEDTSSQTCMTSIYNDWEVLASHLRLKQENTDLLSLLVIK